MNVRVVKSGRNELSAQINFFRRLVFTAQFARSPNRNNFFAVNRDGFGNRKLRVSCENFAVIKQQTDFLFRLRQNNIRQKKR